MDELSAGPGPDSIAAFEERLVALSPGLPKRLRQCADYIALNADRIAVSTVADFARGADVPPSAVMRFCQILGFSGYSALQKLFRGHYAQVRPDYATRLANLAAAGAASAPALLAEFIGAGQQSLEALARETDEAALARAVKALAGAGLIHVAGYRRAFPVASYIAYALEKMEIPALLHDGTGKLDHAKAVRKGDALIAISFAPYSTETVTLAEVAASLELPVVAITDTKLSPLAETATELLCVPEVDFGAFRSLSATLALAIALAVAVGAARG